MNRVPYRVDVGHLVGEELDEEEHGRAEDHHGMAENAETRRKRKEVEVLRRAEYGDRSVDVQAGSECRAERKTKQLEGVHPSPVYRLGRQPRHISAQNAPSSAGCHNPTLEK